MVEKAGIDHVLRMVNICFQFPKDSKSLHSPLDQVLQLRCLKLLDAVVVDTAVDEKAVCGGHCWSAKMGMD